MNRNALGALIALNLALLVALVVVTFSPQPANAQIGGTGNYVMVSGEIEGRSQQSGVYIIDLNNAVMYWIIYNSDSDELIAVDRRDIRPDFEAQRRR